MTLLVRQTVEVVFPEFGGRGHARYDRPWLEERGVETTAIGVAVHEGVTVTAEGLAVTGGCYSPDGSAMAALAHPYLEPTQRPLLAEAGPLMAPLAYFQGSGRMADLWVGADGDLELCSSEWVGSGAVAWSPDGTRIAYTSDLLGLCDDGDPLMVNVLDLATNQRASWGPWAGGVIDILAWTPSSAELWFVRSEGMGPEQAWALNIADNVLRACLLPIGVQGFAWSDDGQALAVAHAGDPAGITIYRSDGSERTYPTGFLCWMPVWLGPDHIVFNAREEVAAEGTSVSLDSVHILRVSDGVHDAVLHSQSAGRGAWCSPRALAVRAPRSPAARWWDKLLGEEWYPAPMLPDARDVSEKSGLWMEAKLALADLIDPALRARYEADWKT